MSKLLLWLATCWLVVGLAYADDANDQCAVQLGQQQTYYEELMTEYKSQCKSRPLRILAPTSLAAWIPRQAARFEELVGTAVNLTLVDDFRIPSNIELQLSGWAQQDLWMVDGASLPPLAYRDALLTLDERIKANAAVEWSDIHPLWASLSKARNKTIAMPIDSDVLLLYYRRDTMDARNMSVPASWAELEQLAAAWNARSTSTVPGIVKTIPRNTSSPDSASSPASPPPPTPPPPSPPANPAAQPLPLPRYGLCLSDASGCTPSSLLAAILASITQRWGPLTGWAVSLEQSNADLAVGELVNGTAMYLALETYSSLMAQSPSGLACQQTQAMFAKGECLMTISLGAQFKALQAADVPVRGVVGISLTPGSSQVYDRTHGVLVSAGPQACSAPVRSSSSSSGSGSSESTWACRTPMLSYGGTFGVIGLRNGAAYQDLAFQFLAFLTSSDVQRDGLMGPVSLVEPVRLSMLQASAEGAMAGQVSGGYSGFHPADVKAYLAALRQAFSSANVGVELGAPGAFDLRSHMESAVAAYMGGASAEEVADAMLRSWLAEWALRGYSTAQVRQMLVDAAVDPSNNHTQVVKAPATREALSWGVGIAVLGGVVLLTAVAFSLFSWCKRRTARRALLRRIVAPTIGAETSLVVTDIQDSTKLWELLSSDVMDSAIGHHHSLARRLMLQFQGYESATEGDSFIIAFQTADDAVCFCAAFQQELMHVPWPAELLMLEGCKPVYMCKSIAEPLQRKGPQAPQLEVSRSQAPLSPFTLAAISNAAVSGSYHGGVRRSTHAGGPSTRIEQPTSSGQFVHSLATYAAVSASTPGGNGHYGTTGQLHGAAMVLGAQSCGQLLQQQQQELNLPPTVSVPAAGAMLPRFARSTAPYSLATPGSPGSMGAVGATPRQMSFLGRSASRLGMTSVAASVTAATVSSSAVPSGAMGAVGGSGLERIPTGLPAGENPPAEDAYLPVPPASASNTPASAPSDAAAIGVGAGAKGGNDATAARARLAAGAVMSFRESFRAERGASLSENNGGLELPVGEGSLQEAPTLTGYQCTAASAPRVSDGGGGSGVDRHGSGGGSLGGAPSRSRSLARSVSMMDLESREEPHHSHSDGNGDSGFGPTGHPRATGPLSSDGAAAAGNGGSGTFRLADRPTPHSRQSKSTDIAFVSEFNTILESTGFAYVRPSENGYMHVSPPGTSVCSVGTAVQSQNLDQLRRAGNTLTGDHELAAVATSPRGSGALSPATRSTGPLAEGVGHLTLPSPSADPEYSPRAATRRASVTFDFHAAPISTGSPAGGGASSGAGGGGGGGACSSGDEAYASGGGARASISMPTPRLGSHSRSTPRLEFTVAGLADIVDDRLSGNTTYSHVSYTSPALSQRSSAHASSGAHDGAASRHLHSSCSGVQGNPDTASSSPPMPFSCRAASRRRCSDITGAAGFTEYASQYGTLGTTGSIQGAANSPMISQSQSQSLSAGHESGLRPSPLGRGSTQIAAVTGYRSRIRVSSGGCSDGTGGGRSSNSRSLRGPFVDGEEGERELPDPAFRGQSSPLPKFFVGHRHSDEDRPPTGGGVADSGGEGEGEGGVASADDGAGGGGRDAGGSAPDGAVSVPLNPFSIGRYSRAAVPLKRSLTTAPRAAGATVSGSGVLRSGQGTIVNGGATPCPTPRVTAAATIVSSSSGARGIFGLVGLPSPRPGGTGLLGLGMGLSHTLHAVDSRAGSMASMMRLASQQNLQSVGETLCSRWRVVEERESGAQLVFRGLRVRMGVHSGLSEECDAVQINRTLNRTQYTGLGLQMAKAVCDCAHGGQVLMSEAAFTQLAVEGLKERVMVLHMGEHRMKSELPATSIYFGCPRALQGRIPALRTLRSQQQHSLGVLEAPAGLVVVVFMHVVGAMSLLDWRADLAHSALAMFRDHVSLELIKHQGYLVEAVDGLVLASFSSPAAGLRWVAKCQHDMTMLPWPQELLSHEACEELCTMRINPVTAVQEEVVLFRGLRLKAGVDMGRLRGEINCITGRMSYRGRAMNRAARIVATAGSGQILASSDVWRASSSQAVARMCGLTAVSLGQFNLKGVSEPIEVFQIKTSIDITSKRSKAVLSSVEDPLELDELPIADPAAALHHHAAINNTGSAAAAMAAAAVVAGGGAGGPAGALALRMGSSSAAAAGGMSAGLPARLMLERVQSMTGGLAAALRREESLTRGGRGNLSRQLSRNVSVRSRRSSRRSSVGSQYSALATNTMVALARGSFDGRLDVISPVRSGAVQHVAAAALHTSLSQMPPLASIGSGPHAGSGPMLSYATPSGSHMNTLGSMTSLGAHGIMGAAGGGVNPPYAFNLPSIGSGTRTSRNSTIEPVDTDGNRSSNPRSSNPSVRSAVYANQGVSPFPQSQSHGQVHTGIGSPLPSRGGPGQGLVRHISTLIRSASLALYGSSGSTHGGGGAAAPGPSSGTYPPPLPPAAALLSIGTALSPTLETTYEASDSGACINSSDRRGGGNTVTGASPAAVAGLPSIGSPTGGGGHGGGGLRDLLPPRLRAAGSIFRVGSFSGHVRRRADDGTRASDYDYHATDRRNRSPPPGRRMASTVSGLRYTAAPGGGGGGGGGSLGIASGLPSSPDSALYRAPSRRRSSVDPLRPRSATVDRAGAAGVGGVGTSRRAEHRESLTGLVEGPEAAENSFVIVVGEDDADEQEQVESLEGLLARAEGSRGGHGSSRNAIAGTGAGAGAGQVGAAQYGHREGTHASIARMIAASNVGGNAGQQQQPGGVGSASAARWDLGGPNCSSGGGSGGAVTGGS